MSETKTHQTKLEIFAKDEYFIHTLNVDGVETIKIPKKQVTRLLQDGYIIRLKDDCRMISNDHYKELAGIARDAVVDLENNRTEHKKEMKELKKQHLPFTVVPFPKKKKKAAKITFKKKTAKKRKEIAAAFKQLKS